MTNMKTTKKALIFSALSLLLCFSMLIGTTFAWFTDSVTSSGNIIQSGTLKLDVELYDAENKEWNSIKEFKDPIFNYDNWEPGYVDVKMIKIENEGSLAFKWVATFTAEKELSILADVIDVYVRKSATAFEYPASRELSSEWEKVGTAREFINSIDEVVSGVLNSTNDTAGNGGVEYIGFALKMQETAGNEYQKLSLGGAFDIQFLATQMTYEDDSFDNQYDANAPYSFWDGTVPAEMPASLVVDGATQTIHVKDAAAFAYLGTLSAKWVELYTDGNGREWTNYANGAGADFYYSNKWTVSLEADIDLGNYPIAPVDVKIGESTGASAFNGNGHTIRNINTTTGLFADKARTSFANIILENVKATNGALIGSADHNITGITVKNATISGVDYVGGIVGYIYGGVNDCKVIDSSVVATGKEAGGLIGYVATSNNEAHVANNIVNNVSVYAGNRAAGLIAQVNANVKVHNNTIDTVTVGAADTSKYQANAVVSNALDAANVYDNTVKNATVKDNVAIVGDSAALADAVKNSDTVVLTAGTYTFPASSMSKDNTLICDPDTVFNGAKLDANGATVVGATFSNTASSNTVDGIYKDCTFTGSNGLRYGYVGETAVFENCVFSGNTYGIHFDGGANEVIFKNCTISGFNATAAAVTKVTFEGCTFVGNGKSSYNGINLWGDGDFKDCTFVFDGSSTYEWIDLCSGGKTANFVNCVVSDGTTTSNVSTLIGDKLTKREDSGKIIVDGVEITY